jgi:hypothetical protein
MQLYKLILTMAVAMITATAVIPTIAAPYTTNQAPDRYEMDRPEYLAGYAYAVRYCNLHHIETGSPIPDSVFTARDAMAAKRFKGKADSIRIYISGFNQALRDIGFSDIS